MNGRSCTVVSDRIKIVGQECPTHTACGSDFSQMRARNGYTACPGRQPTQEHRLTASFFELKLALSTLSIERGHEWPLFHGSVRQNQNRRTRVSLQLGSRQAGPHGHCQSSVVPTFRIRRERWGSLVRGSAGESKSSDKSVRPTRPVVPTLRCA